MAGSYAGHSEMLLTGRRTGTESAQRDKSLDGCRGVVIIAYNIC